MGLSDLEGELDAASLHGDIILPVSESAGGGPDAVPGAAYDTLDEPVLTSISRDLKAVGQKLMLVLLPSSNNKLMRDWDLWGPLFLCIYIGLLLQGMAETAESSRFTTIFLVMWIGTVGVTYNAVFLNKATMSVFQFICVIGYCLAPEAIAVSIFELLHVFGVGGDQIVLRLLLVAASVGWSSFASFSLLRSSTDEEKQIVVLGPIILFYVTMGILIALYTYADY